MSNINLIDRIQYKGIAITSNKRSPRVKVGAPTEGTEGNVNGEPSNNYLQGPKYPIPKEREIGRKRRMYATEH
jgi:hypothetical protein